MSKIEVDEVVNQTGDNDSGLDLSTNDVVAVKTANTERMRVDASGNLFVGKTSSSSATDGFEYNNGGQLAVTRNNDTVILANRRSNHGDIIDLRIDNNLIGSIGSEAGKLNINSDGGNNLTFAVNGTTYIAMDTVRLYPNADNNYDLGTSSLRFDDIFATNGTIQTSDQNEKNTITDSDLGLDFVNRLAPKSYIFNGKTRTHYGLIAQDVETVLSDISKETSEFAGFIKEDISEGQDGSQYRYGLRYTEFVGILIKALQEADDKIDALTARVTALEDA